MIKVYAPEVTLPHLAVARLRRIEPQSKSMVGVYLLQPLDPAAYVSRMVDINQVFGSRYAPTPGMWATYQIMDNEDELELHVGLQRVYGRALHAANQSLRGVCEYLVPAYQVRALALGFLDSHGM